MVCQSGIAYCTSLAVNADSASQSQAYINKDMPTIPYLQDLQLEHRGHGCTARKILDCGSNRVLVNNDFASENDMPPTSAMMVMKTVVGHDKKIDV